MPPQAGYAIASITDLKAIGPEHRTEGYARLVIEKDAWYLFRSDLSNAGDDDLIVVPDDNPVSGRFIKSGGSNNGSWKVINQDYDAALGDRLIVDTINGFFNAGIVLPFTPNTGSYLELIITSSNTLNIQLNGRNYKGATGEFQRLEINTPFKSVGLIYVDNVLGWIPTDDLLLTLTSGGATL